MITANNLAEQEGIAHGFFTRQGGVSGGVYAGLNCGPGSNDNPSHVQENISRAVLALAGHTVPLCRCSQIHSADVITVEQPWSPNQPPKADALVTKQHEIVIGVLTADCGPILFADTEAGVVGAAHAGWKGAIGGVLENTIAAMEALGARKANIVAALGPCIAQASYEVGPEFYGQFVQKQMLYGTFFRESAKQDHYLFDLAGFIRHQLLQSGLHNVEVIGKDTYSDEAQFFSFRRTTHRGETDYGRQLSAIMLK